MRALGIDSAAKVSSGSRSEARAIHGPYSRDVALSASIRFAIGAMRGSSWRLKELEERGVAERSSIVFFSPDLKG
jgi:hypothetical protein